MSLAADEGALRGGVSLRVGAPLVAFVLASLCAVLPILMHSYLPLIDLPNHIARMHIAAHGDGALARYYTSELSLVPNSAVDYLWMVWPFGDDPVVFSKYVMAFYAVSFIGSGMFLARVIHGRWTLWSAAVALIVFNGPFFWGFQNFVVSLPFCLVFLGLWLLLEARGLTLRLAVFFPLALALYLMHFFAFMILAVAVFGREVQVAVTGGGAAPRRLGRLFALMLPFGAPVLWLIYGMVTGPAAAPGSRTEFGSVSERFIGLFSPFTSVNAWGVPPLQVIGYLAGALVGLCLVTLFLRRGPRLEVSPKMVGPLVALGFAALVAPTWLSGVALVHYRVPVVLCAVFFAATQWRGLSPRRAVYLALCIGVLVGLRSVYFEKFTARYDADIRDMLGAMQDLPAGARVFPARGPGMEQDRRFFHVQAYAVTERDAFVPTLFLGTHSVQLKPEWEAYAHPALFAVDLRRILQQDLYPVLPSAQFMSDWQAKYTHVLLLDKDERGVSDDPRLTLERRQGQFSLFRVAPPV
ncbi:hypothetical protein IV417_07305 [Alphaproteobacteria bacterium KMM 3653]|uniref:Uncharacterized protein n=1 Tax=Harenicola maris TaxID=2841044 RepID=A0AAP2CRD5_9RHOB|nr:hypothetical protein [Harenicola maris]